jgi:hypothetical protein
VKRLTRAKITNGNILTLKRKSSVKVFSVTGLRTANEARRLKSHAYYFVGNYKCHKICSHSFISWFYNFKEGKMRGRSCPITTHYTLCQNSAGLTEYINNKHRDNLFPGQDSNSVRATAV